MFRSSPNILAKYINALNRFNPNGEVIIYGDRRVTWSDLHSRVMKLAQALVHLGLKKNEKVAFMFFNSPEFFETNFAIQVAGGIPVPVNYRFTESEIVYQVNHCNASLFIFDGEFQDVVMSAENKLKHVHFYICKNGKKRVGVLDFDSLISKEQAKDPCIPTKLSDLSVIIYTGGTTGVPKGVMLTYQSQIDVLQLFLTNMPEQILKLDLKSDLENLNGFKRKMVRFLFWLKRQSWAHYIFESKKFKKGLWKVTGFLITRPSFLHLLYPYKLKLMSPSMPLFHTASYTFILLSAVAGNVVFVFPESISLNVEQILNLIQEERPVAMGNVPTGWKKIISFDRFEEFDISSLKFAYTGSAVTSIELKKKIFEKFPGIVIADAFGQTEMVPACLRFDTGPETLKNRSVGKAWVDTKIIDDTGKEVAPGEIGEICFKSPTMMKGYYKEDVLPNGNTTDDGWLRSGDLGFMDEDGEINIVDRKKECINTGGEKVFPMEVEDVLQDHPKVEKVCVIGVPDDMWGHQVRAVVKLKKGETATSQEIIDFCRGKLAGYKICKSVVFVDDLPITSVGKIRRGEIKKQYSQVLTHAV